MRSSLPTTMTTAGLVLGLLVGLAPVVEAKSNALAEMLPAGRTLAYVEVASLEGAKALVESSDLGKLWAAFRPACDDLSGALDAAMADLYAQMESETGLKAPELIELLQGGFAIGVVNQGEPGAEPRPAIYVGFPASSAATIREMIGQVKAKAEAEGREVPPPLASATVERKGPLAVLCAMGGPEGLLEPGSADGLAQAAAFKTVRARVWGDAATEGVYLAFVNVRGALAIAPADPDFDRAKDALGLEGIEAAGIGMGVVDGKVHDGLVLATSGERRGLLKALANQPAVDLRKLGELCPSDVTAVSALSLDLIKLKSDLLDVAEAMEPGARAEAEKGFADAEAEVGFTMDELFGSLGDLWVLEQHVPQDGLALLSEHCASVAVKDVARVQRILSDIVARTGFEVRTLERGGISVKYLLAPLGKLGEEPFQDMPEAQVGTMVGLMSVARAWSVHNGRLYIAGSPTTIADRFERLKKGTLAESEHWKRAVAAMKPGARVVVYGRPDRAVGPLYHTALWALRLLEPVIRGAGVPLDTALLPSPAQVAGSLGASVTAWRVDATSMSLTSDGGGLPLMTVGGGTLFFLGAGFAGFRSAEPRMAPMEPARAAAVSPYGVLGELQAAQERYKSDRGTYAGSLEDLFAAGLIDPGLVFESPSYSFHVESADASSYKMIARPNNPARDAIWAATPNGIEQVPFTGSEQGGPSTPLTPPGGENP